MDIPTSKPTLIPMCKISIEVLKLLTQIDYRLKSITTLFQYNTVILFFYTLAIAFFYYLATSY